MPEMAHITLNRPANIFKIQKIMKLTWATRIIKETKQSEVTTLPAQKEKKRNCSTSSNSNKSDRLFEYLS